MAMKIIHSRNMPVSKIDDMQIVPDAGAVSRVIVITEHRQFSPRACGQIGDIGNKVIRDAPGIFAYFTDS